jgi:hypothetical protein
LILLPGIQLSWAMETFHSFDDLIFVQAYLF